MTIAYYHSLVQGSDEWRALRCGMITASTMDLILTPTLKVASNDKERAHLYELLAQRVTGYVEPEFLSFDMVRGMEEEIEAKQVYQREYAALEDCGFIVNDELGFNIGFSPDALVGRDGLIECKSRMQKHQMKTILGGVVPPEYMLQIQTGLFVSGREWCDFVSYCGGLPMMTVRVTPDMEMRGAIIDAACQFEEKLNFNRACYEAKMRDMSTYRLVPTERKGEQQEMFVS